MDDREFSTESDTVGQPQQQQQEQQERAEPADSALSDRGGSNVSDRAPYAVSLRVILFLSLVCWALIAVAIAWLLG